MRLVTWNVNSLRARMERVEEWIAAHTPDVLCLQETKMKDEVFPAERFDELGYRCLHWGKNQWNGVAILSRIGLDDPVVGLSGDGGDGEARIVAATCGGVRVVCVYVPNGRSVGSEHYVFKLRWLADLRNDCAAMLSAGGDVAVCGDFNIAPDDLDVWDPAELEGFTHVSAPERDALSALCELGLVDVFRTFHPEGHVFSWWDYRGGNFHKGIGMRIDLVLASTEFASRVRGADVDRDARKSPQPSDHAPVVVDFAE